MTRRRRGEGGQTPVLLFPPALLGVLFLAVPALALVVRAPWSGLWQIYRDNDVLTELRISVLTSAEATVLLLLLGVPLASILARVRLVSWRRAR